MSRSTRFLLPFAVMFFSAAAVETGALPFATIAVAEVASPSQLECRSGGLHAASSAPEALVFVQAGKSYQVLTGSVAFQHLSDKRLRNPERFVGMGRALAARGYRPTDRIVVLRSLGTDLRPAGQLVPGSATFDVREAATTFTNSQGEQIFWSWDDGDDATWEGSQYVERYSDNAWVTYDGQLDISNTNGDAIWGEKTGGGGGGIVPDNQASWRRQSSDRIVFAELSRASRLGSLRLAQEEEGTETGGGDGKPQEGLTQEFRDWAACLVGGCMGCAGGCLFTGPVYPECYGACCFGVSIACAIDYYF